MSAGAQSGAMSASDEYRAKAAQLRARAQQELSAVSQASLKNLALSYLRLAEQAEKNATTDLVYETPQRLQPAQQSQQLQQQQQQQRSEKEDNS
jgi:hypothetical protein